MDNHHDDLIEYVHKQRYVLSGNLYRDIADRIHTMRMEPSAENVKRYQEEVIDLVRYYGAMKEEPDKDELHIGETALFILHQLAKKENRAIITDGNWLHLGNVIDDAQNQACGKEDDMSRCKVPVTLPDGRRVWLIGSTLQEAFTKGLMKYGNIAREQPEKRDLPLFNEYAARWLEVFQARKVKGNTLNNTISMMNKHIYPAFEGMRLDEITVEAIQRFYTSKDSLAESTVDKMRIILHQVLDAAKEDKLISDNPAYSSRLTISSRKTKREPLTMEQLRDILSNADKLTMEDRTLLYLFAYTGMRRGEVLGLQWGDIDFDNKRINVERAVSFTSNKPIIGKPKSEAGNRCVPLLDQLAEHLQALPNKAGFVIGGEAPCTAQTYKRAWERIGKTINLYGATAHVFRHTFATIFQTMTDPKTLQTVLGHADIMTTMNTYVHPQEEAARQAANRLTDAFCATFSES